MTLNSHRSDHPDTDTLSIIPLLQPTLKRSVLKKDLKPSLLLTGSTNNEQLCRVCQQHAQRYTCPRCDTPYCSVACYQQHGSRYGKGSSCTEGFYQDRVTSVLNLEAKDQSKSMHQILNRSHDMFAPEEEVTEQDEEEDQLWRLAEALEKGTLDEEAERLLLSPAIHSAFLRAVQNGELSHVLQSWQPWWTTDLWTDTDTSSEKIVDRDRKTTLDERLLKIPSFASLRPGNAPLPSLGYNMIDLLYSTALTLRLYHGLANALDSSLEASQTLLTSSSVLGEDARYSSVSNVLVVCTASSTRALHSREGCNSHWTVLAADVIALLENRRHIAHALFDAIDITKVASQAAKREGAASDNVSQLRRVRKKLEFYLSWSRDAPLLTHVVVEIRNWMETWKNENTNEHDLDRLQLPKAISETPVSSRCMVDDILTNNTSSLLNELKKTTAFER